jgi:hypothetical protein
MRMISRNHAADPFAPLTGLPGVTREPISVDVVRGRQTERRQGSAGEHPSGTGAVTFGRTPTWACCTARTRDAPTAPWSHGPVSQAQTFSEAAAAAHDHAEHDHAEQTRMEYSSLSPRQKVSATPALQAARTTLRRTEINPKSGPTRTSRSALAVPLN